MKKPLTYGIITVVLLVLVFVIPSKKKDKTDKNKPIQIISVREPLLSELKLTKLDGTVLAIKRNEKGYKILNTKFDAGRNEINGYVAGINSMVGFSANLSKKAPANAAQFEVTFKNGKKVTVKVIAQRKYGKPAFFIEKEGKVFVVQKRYVDKIFSYNVNKLRNHMMIDYASKDLKSITINKLNLYQKGPGKWFVKGLDEKKTNSRKVFMTYGNISTTRIKEFTNVFNARKLGITKPNYTVTFQLANGKKRIIFYAEKNKKYYAYEKGKEVYEIPASVWQHLGRNVKYFSKDAKNKSGKKLPFTPLNKMGK